VRLPNDAPLPVVLLANKCDLPPPHAVKKEELDAFCKEHGFVKWYETSAKENINIEESVKGLVSSILEHSDALGAQKEAKKDEKGVSMSLAGEAPKKEGGCC
jgi:Ras-related protein Rab-32